MANLQLHPDGWVYIRTDNEVYVDTPENLALDSGIANPFELLTELTYIPNEKYRRDKKIFNPPYWEIGNSYISNVATIVTAKMTRELPLELTLSEEIQIQTSAINGAAYAARGRYITHGKSTTYAAQNAEVQKWISAGEPSIVSDVDDPRAAQRAAIKTVKGVPTTTVEVLSEWKAIITLWITKDMEIVEIVESAKIDLNLASTLEDAKMIGAAAVAALNLL